MGLVDGHEPVGLGLAKDDAAWPLPASLNAVPTAPAEYGGR